MFRERGTLASSISTQSMKVSYPGVSQFMFKEEDLCLWCWIGVVDKSGSNLNRFPSRNTTSLSINEHPMASTATAKRTFRNGTSSMRMEMQMPTGDRVMAVAEGVTVAMTETCLDLMEDKVEVVDSCRPETSGRRRKWTEIEG